jgi:hypothetical protein
MSRVSPQPPRQLSRSSQVCLAIVLAAGLNIIWGVGLAWAVSFVSAITEKNDFYTQLLFTPNGTPIRLHRFADGRAPENTTLDGKPFPATETTPWLAGAGFSVESPPADWSVMKPVAPVVEGYSDGLRTPTDWFCLQFPKPHAIAYFVGYDRVSQRRVGYIGRTGFQLEEPTAAQAFVLDHGPGPEWGGPGIIAPRGSLRGVTPAEYYYQNLAADRSPGAIPPAVYYLVAKDRTMRIDLRSRTVATVLEAPGLDRIATLTRTRDVAAAAAAKPVLDDAIAVRGPGTVTVLDASGRQETVFQLPAELSDRTFTFFQLPDRTALAHVYRTDRAKRMAYQDLIWFTKDGTITRRIDGALSFPISQLSLVSQFLLVGCAVPMPVGPIGVVLVWPLTPDNGTSARTYHEAVLEELPAVLPAAIAAALWTALAIWLYYRRTAKYGEPRHAAWIVSIGVLGLPGYFGYVLRRHWTARIPCPSCGVPAPRDRDECFHCGEVFPTPAANGLEIFA